MNTIFTPKNRAYEIVSNKFPCFDVIFDDYEIYDITHWKEKIIYDFIEMNKKDRNLKVSTTFTISQEGDDTQKKLLMLTFLRTSITAYNRIYNDLGQDWIYKNTVIRHYFDEVTFDILDNIDFCEEYEDDSSDDSIDKYDNIKEIVNHGIEQFMEEFNDYVMNTDEQKYPLISDQCENGYIKFLEKEIIDDNFLIYVGRQCIEIEVDDSNKQKINNILEEYYEELISMDGRLQLMRKKIDNDIYATFEYGKNNKSHGLTIETDYGYAILLTNASDL